MKIALLLFSIDWVGGILTYHRALKEGLKRCGHEVRDYYLTLNKKKKPKEYYGMDGCLGFMSREMLDEYFREMENFDLAIFTNPCPYLRKDFQSKDWQRCYDIYSPIIVVFHDPHLEHNYPWILDVKDKIRLAAGVQPKALLAAKKYFRRTFVTNHMLVLDDMGLYDEEKEDVVISPQTFKRWKRVDLLIRAVPGIRYSVEVYGDGIVQAYMAGKRRRKEYFDEEAGEWIWDRALACGMKYFGRVPDIIPAFKRAKAVVNMATGEWGTKFGLANYRSVDYTILEAMKYGAVPIVSEWAIMDYITRDNVELVYEKDLPMGIADAANRVIENFEDYRSLRERNLKLLEENVECERRAKALLDALE